MTTGQSSGGIPHVSIGLPVFNGQSFLAQGLDSLLGQTFTDFEIIISDNASTDGTAAIARAYAQRDARVRYVRQDVNRGATWNFNHVLALARGPLFRWHAADDMIGPAYLQRCIEVMNAHPEVAWVHTRTMKIDQDGAAIDTARRPVIFDNRFLTPAQRLSSVLMEKGWTSRISGLIRVEALRRCRSLLPVYGSEKVLMAELVLQGQYHEVCETLFQRRIHLRASASMTTATEQQTFCDPVRRRRAMFPRLRILAGIIGGVVRSPMRIDDRLWCMLVIGRYLLQASKWTNVVTGTILGRGTGGGNIETLRRIGQLPHEARAQRPVTSA